MGTPYLDANVTTYNYFCNKPAIGAIDI